MNTSSIKIFKSKGIVAMCNIWNNSIGNSSEVFNTIKECNSHTLVVNGLDENALYYYINKYHFPTVKTIIYFGGSGHPQDTKGIYEFDKIMVTKHFNENHTNEKFTFMTQSQIDEYKSLTDKLDKDIQESQNIMTTYNAIDYFKYIKTPPKVEIIE
jgi:hypothetical protein